MSLSPPVDDRTGPDHGHELVLESTEEDRLDRLASWVRVGLVTGEKIVLPRTPISGPDPLLDELERRQVDAATALGDGRLALAPLEEWAEATEAAVIVERALADGFSGVRVATDAGDAITAMSPAAYQRREAAIDQLCHDRRVTAMCQLVGSTPLSTLHGAVGAHLTRISGPGFRTSVTAGSLAIAGELDIANVDAFAAVVERACRLDGGRLTFDLAALEYAGVAPAGALLTASASFRRSGGRLVLGSLTPAVARLVELVGLADEPGIEIGSSIDDRTSGIAAG